MPYVYLLECADGTYYVGSAKDLEFRLEQHAAAGADAFTAARHRQPVRLVWAHECDRIDEAYVLERKIRGWRREKKLALIEGRYGDLPALSRNRSTRRSDARS